MPKVQDRVSVESCPVLVLIAGKKFAQVEFVAFLVMVIRQFEVQLKDGWTADKTWAILNNSKTTVTLAPPSNIPLTFIMRDTTC